MLLDIGKLSLCKFFVEYRSHYLSNTFLLKTHLLHLEYFCFEILPLNSYFFDNSKIKIKFSRKFKNYYLNGI